MYVHLHQQVLAAAFCTPSVLSLTACETIETLLLSCGPAHLQLWSPGWSCPSYPTAVWLLLSSCNTAAAAPAVLKASCPLCAGQLSQPHLRRLVPEAVEQLLELQTDIWLQQHGIIRCVVLLSDGAGPSSCTQPNCSTRAFG
jgi:hypothetical protein